MPSKPSTKQAESQSASAAAPSVNVPLSRKEKTDRFMKALVENLNRNVLAELAEQDKPKKSTGK
jgi:hypothetical protein